MFTKYEDSTRAPRIEELMYGAMALPEATLGILSGVLKKSHAGVRKTEAEEWTYFLEKEDSSV